MAPRRHIMGNGGRMENQRLLSIESDLGQTKSGFGTSKVYLLMGPTHHQVEKKLRNRDPLPIHSMMGQGKSMTVYHNSR